MSKGFKSSDFAFRPTSMSAAFIRAGLKVPPSFVREPKAVGVPVEGDPFIIASPALVVGSRIGI